MLVVQTIGVCNAHQSRFQVLAHHALDQSRHHQSHRAAIIHTIFLCTNKVVIVISLYISWISRIFHLNKRAEHHEASWPFDRECTKWPLAPIWRCPNSCTTPSRHHTMPHDCTQLIWSFGMILDWSKIVHIAHDFWQLWVQSCLVRHIHERFAFLIDSRIVRESCTCAHNLRYVYLRYWRSIVTHFALLAYLSTAQWWTKLLRLHTVKAWNEQ